MVHDVFFDILATFTLNNLVPEKSTCCGRSQAQCFVEMLPVAIGSLMQTPAPHLLPTSIRLVTQTEVGFQSLGWRLGFSHASHSKIAALLMQTLPCYNSALAITPASLVAMGLQTPLTSTSLHQHPSDDECPHGRRGAHLSHIHQTEYTGSAAL